MYSHIPAEYRQPSVPRHLHPVPKARLSRAQVIAAAVVLAVGLYFAWPSILHYVRGDDVSSKLVSCSATSSPEAFPNGNVFVSFNLTVTLELHNRTGQDRAVTVKGPGGVAVPPDAAADGASSTTLQPHETRTVSYEISGLATTDCSYAVQSAAVK